MAISLSSVKLSQIPEAQPLAENGLELSLEHLGMSRPWLGPRVSVTYELSRIYGKILGKFEAKAHFELPCSRCLENFQAEARAKFLVNFEERPPEADERKGLDPEDPELNVAFYDDDLIEFGDEVRQELELQLPFAPLCRPDCRGLCAVCGGNKNEKECKCGDVPKNNPFQGLEKLIQRNKEN